MLLTKQDFVDAARATRAAFSWPVFWTLLAIMTVVVLLSWLGSYADPRSEAHCAEPGDLGFLLFFLSLPVIGGSALVGLGEAVEWSRLRATRPDMARRHRRRAATLLAASGGACAAVAGGFMVLCRIL